MKNATTAVLALLLFAGAAGSVTETKWSVTSGSTAAGTITMLSGPQGIRTEWKKDPKAAPVVFLFVGGKTWVRETGGDIELDTYKGGVEKTVVPALMKADWSKSATIKADAYTLKRTSMSSSNADASNFAVRPKKGAASRLARLSGDLLGPSSSGVSGTAGTRGAGREGLKLKDGGDYEAVERIDKRDAKWSSTMDKALAEFQKDGKVGKQREEQ